MAASERATSASGVVSPESHPDTISAALGGMSLTGAA
jgi:hypothetical protein